MPTVLRRAVPATILMTGLFWAYVTPSRATPAYTKKEGKPCLFCHVANGKPELNAAGDYYAAHDHSLKGYKSSKATK